MTSASKTFPPLDLDDVDARLDARAAERGIPTLTATPVGPAVNASVAEAGAGSTAAKTVASARATPKDSGKPAVGRAVATPKPMRRRTPKPIAARPEPVAPEGLEPTPRARMKPLNVELPDYVWIELKSRAARQMVSVRHIILMLLDEAGITVAEVDKIEDGRRLR